MFVKTPSITDCYPSAILERLEALPAPDELTEQQRRIIAIIDDKEVMQTARPFLADEGIDAFWSFIETAATLPDELPPGMHLREIGETPTFSTPANLRKEITDTAYHAMHLADLLRKTATTITGSDLTIGEIQRLIDQLEALQCVCNAKAAKHSSKAEDQYVFPVGGTAGANSWRNWLLKRLSVVAEVRLGIDNQTYPSTTERNAVRGRIHTLVREIHRVLLELETPIDARTADGAFGVKTFLDRDGGANTFNAWALDNNYPTQS